MKYNYLVIGAGRQGTAVIYDLIEHCEAKQVIVHEPSTRAKDKAKKHLVKIFGNEKLRHQKIVFIDTLHDDVIRDSDVMINCAPYFTNAEYTRRAINNDTAYCDLGGNPEMVEKQFRIVREKQAATSKDIEPVVPECGLAPGLVNIIAAHLADGYNTSHGATDIRIYCGGLPVWDAYIHEDAGALNYRLAFSLEGLLSEYTGKAPIIEDGELVMVDALGGDEVVDGFEAAYTSNISSRGVDYLKGLGVQNFSYKTLRYPGHWQIVRSWKEMGLLHDDQSKNGPLLEILKNNPAIQPNAGEFPEDVVYLIVTGGKRDGLEEALWSYDIIIPYDRVLGFTAMESSTSWGVAMVAHQLAADKDHYQGSGFWPPETIICRKMILEGLNKRLLLLEDRNK